jgi:hypothetical protein
MVDLIRSDPSHTDTEGYVVSGWSALERNDVEGARAALQDLYSADPTHPALQLLAAGIRRIRPQPHRWRAAVLLLIVVVAGILAIRTWSRQDRVDPQQQPAVSNQAEADALPQSTALSPADTRELGTTGQIQAPALPTVKQNPSSAAIDEDVVVRQAIQRFEATYRSRWGALAFEHCDVSREVDQANATCVPRHVPNTPDVESEQVWTFSLRKSESGWKIVSVQPPPNSVQ